MDSCGRERRTAHHCFCRYPALTTQELTAMNLPDMLSLAAKVIGFLSPASAE